MRRKPTIAMIVMGFVGVVVAVVARQPIVEFFKGATSVPPPPQVQLPKVTGPADTPSPAEIARPHLTWADKETERVIDEHLKSLDRFFVDSKAHTGEFASEALSWGSKWRLMADKVPFTRGGRHEEYIRGKFEEFVFKPDDLESVVKQVVENYVKHIESIEGKMLVRIKADVADFPSAYVLSQIDDAKIRHSYDEAVKSAIASAGSDLQADIGTELISMITGEVLTQVAVRLCVSAGVLGVGAASSWATLGIGAVVALIVDQIISWVWDWYADPKGELAVELNGKLDEIKKTIVDDTKDAPGLRERLRKFAKDRAVLREEAVLSLLQSK